jgi:hypothetical protein
MRAFRAEVLGSHLCYRDIIAIVGAFADVTIDAIAVAVGNVNHASIVDQMFWSQTMLRIGWHLLPEQRLPSLGNNAIIET